MTFNSLPFAVFMVFALAGYYVTPSRQRWLALLVASGVFYGLSDVAHLPVLAALVVASYALGIAIERAQGQGARRLMLFAGLAALTLALVGFRYGAALDTGIAFLAVPLGLSFFTVRLAGYLVDVFRRTGPAEHHIGRFSTFAALFPELPSGPIERAGALLPQLRSPSGLRYEAVTSGAKLFAWGLFKKVLLADRLRLFVGAVYDGPAPFDGASCAVATVFFAAQIYCDFSGYSDMATGIGQVFGLTLARNFDRPYQAKSISEFWTRWHISFSTWLRDYVFLPLVYRADRLMDGRVSDRFPRDKAGYAFATGSTMALCGLWHGASWNYLAWGLVMASFMIVSVLTRRVRSRVSKRVYAGARRGVRGPVRTLSTFSLVCVSWVFFRANSLGEAVQILGAIPRGICSYAARAAGVVASGMAGAAELTRPFYLGQTTYDLVLVLCGLSLLLLVERLQQAGSVRQRVGAWPLWVKWPVYAAFVLAILVFRVPGGSGFIYAGF